MLHPSHYKKRCHQQLFLHPCKVVASLRSYIISAYKMRYLSNFKKICIYIYAKSPRKAVLSEGSESNLIQKIFHTFSTPIVTFSPLISHSFALATSVPNTISLARTFVAMLSLLSLTIAASLSFPLSDTLM